MSQRASISGYDPDVVKIEGRRTPDPTSHRDLYRMFRAYVEHEDGLTNQRLSWNFTIQGFLFAAYTLSSNKIADVKPGLLNSLKSSNPCPAGGDCALWVGKQLDKAPGVADLAQLPGLAGGDSLGPDFPGPDLAAPSLCPSMGIPGGIHDLETILAAAIQQPCDRSTSSG